MENRPTSWFFAEWISILGTFLVCFVFLFYQNQTQSARSDRLYEMFCELQKQTKDELLQMRKDQYELMFRPRNNPPQTGP